MKMGSSKKSNLSKEELNQTGVRDVGNGVTTKRNMDMSGAFWTS